MTDSFDLTEDKGLTACQQICIELGWIYRPKPKSDKGIDAEMETKQLGLLIQAQIKTGKSHFKVYSDHLLYYVSEYHFNYWGNLKAPVIFIAHLPETGKTYWEVVKVNDLKKAKTTWRLIIPFQQEFSKEAKNKIYQKIIPLPKPEYHVITPSDPLEQTRIVTNFMNFGFERELDINVLKQYEQDLLDKSNWYENLLENKRKRLVHPENISLVIEHTILQVKLKNFNEARIDLSAYLNTFRPNTEDTLDRFLFQYARYLQNILNSRQDQVLSLIYNRKIGIFFQFHFTGENLHLLEVEKVNVLLDNVTHILTEEYAYNQFLLKLSLENDFSDIGYSFSLRFIPGGSQEESPKLRGTSVSVSLEILENDCLTGFGTTLLA